MYADTHFGSWQNGQLTGPIFALALERARSRLQHNNPMLRTHTAEMNGTDDKFPLPDLPWSLLYSYYVDTKCENDSSCDDALDQSMPPIDGHSTRLAGTTPPSVAAGDNRKTDQFWATNSTATRPADKDTGLLATEFHGLRGPSKAGDALTEGASRHQKQSIKRAPVKAKASPGKKARASPRKKHVPLPDQQSSAVAAVATTPETDTRQKMTWDDKFQLLEEFKNKNGNCDVKQKHLVETTEGNVALGTWVNKVCTCRVTIHLLCRCSCPTLFSMNVSHNSNAWRRKSWTKARKRA